MIGSARFQNLKALKDVSITFESRLTVLVGPNGSGKTTVLQALDGLCRMTDEGVRDDQKLTILRRDLVSWHSGAPNPMTLEMGDIADQSSRLRVLYDPQKNASQNDDMIVLKFRHDGHMTKFEFGPQGRGKTTTSMTSGPTFGPDLEYNSQLVAFLPSALANPTSTTSTPPRLSEKGEGLASLMSYFKLYDEVKFDQIQSLFCSLIYQVKRIRIGRANVGDSGVLGEELLFDLADRKGVPASAMSDGTLYALGLIAKILDPQRPRVLLIDDIEHGFHPRAQLRLVEMLKKLLDEIPDLQIIATTHSPFILDKLEWNEVRVSGVRDDGSVEILPITDHPEIGRWKEDMTPGEFWATFFENWVTQPKLKPEPQTV